MSSAAQQMAEFAAAVSRFHDEETALHGAVARVAEAVDAEFCAVLDPDSDPELVDATEQLGLGVTLLPDRPDPVSLIVAPLEVGEERRLVVARSVSRPFGSDEHELLHGMARVLGLGLRTIATLAALEERKRLLERLSKIQQSITGRAELQDTLSAIVEGASELLQEPIAAVRLIAPEDPGYMHMAASVGVEEPLLDAVRRGRIGEGAGGRAIAEECLVVIEDYEKAPNTLSAFAKARWQAAMAAPVREKGEVVGSLTIASPTVGRTFSHSERAVLLAFAEHASLALTDARMVADALHQSVHDDLTGLPNRALFVDRVGHALETAGRHDTQVAVLFCDLDHFKVVNDSLGHAAGDELLIAVAGRFRRALRRSDTVARFGGDEFAVLVEDVRTEQDAVRVAEQITALFSRPFPLAGREHFVSASIGIALSHPTADRPDLLIRNADAAMYRAKAHGRAGYEIFDELMRARATHRLRMEGELHRALAHGELVLHYQPLVSLTTEEIVGAEALVRWEHPDRGLLAPGEFIPIAEECGLIVALGEWVLRAACEEAARWETLRPDGPPVGVSVNLSARQVAHGRVAETVELAVRRSGLQPALLTLEITESVLLEDADQPKQNLRALEELGVGLVLDDFGTGYSSLGYLKRLPLAGLKIDRSFVSGLGSDPDDSAIVSAVAGMARGLGLAVTAEGVETAEQAAELIRLGCQRAQGFHFARPMPAEAFRAALQSRAPCPSRLPRSTR